MSALYSSHVFIFPFRFEKGKSGKIKKEAFAQTLPGFMKEDPRIVDKGTSAADYMLSKYFNGAAKRAVFTSSFEHPDKEIVLNYKCDFNGLASYCVINDHSVELEFVIEKVNEIKKNGKTEREEKSYSLLLSNVRIKLFDNGVGTIMFYLENRSYPNVEMINEINEYGRRLFMPNCNQDHRCDLVADKIDIKCNGVSLPICISEINGNIKTGESSCLPNYIKAFLFKNSEAERIYDIKPVIGDRMFVACIFQNDSVSQKLCEWDGESNNYRYISDALKYAPNDPDNVAGLFYKLMCIDVGDVTCQNRSMLMQYNEDHGYRRWVEYGTIYGITEFSMVAVVNNASPDYVWNAFIDEYVEMATLVLVQRATFLVLENSVNETILCGAKSRKLDNLHEKHLVFQSELLLQAITAEQQGIELYEALSKHLLLNEQKKDFNKNIQSLDNYGNFREEKRKSRILFVITLLGIGNTVSPIIQFIADMIGIETDISVFKMAVTIGLVIGFSILHVCNGKHFKKK